MNPALKSSSFSILKSLKHSFLFGLTFLIPFLSNAQTGIHNDSTKVIYCEIIGTTTLLSSKLNIQIDMGESKGLFGLNVSYIKDESTGLLKRFNSMIDAMNYMGEHGWEFVQAYVGPTALPGFHYLLKQVVAKNSDGKYYPVSKKLWDFSK